MSRRQPEDLERPVQHIDSSYDVIEVPQAAKKNCTASGGNCIPKCFAEKGNRGYTGAPGEPGQKGALFFFSFVKSFAHKKEREKCDRSVRMWKMK